MADITISVEEYTELIRQSEQLYMIEKFVESSKYSPTSEIKIILGIKEEDEKQ